MTAFQKVVIRALIHLLDDNRLMNHELKMELLRELRAVSKELNNGG